MYFNFFTLKHEPKFCVDMFYLFLLELKSVWHPSFIQPFLLHHSFDSFFTIWFAPPFFTIQFVPPCASFFTVWFAPPCASFFDPSTPPFSFFCVAKEKEWEKCRRQIQQLSQSQSSGGSRFGRGRYRVWAAPTAAAPAPGPARPPRAPPQLPPPPPWAQLQQTSSPADPSHRTQEIHEVRPTGAGRPITALHVMGRSSGGTAIKAHLTHRQMLGIDFLLSL